MSAIVLTDLHRRYQSGGRVIDAIAGISLQLEPGTLTAIVGRSGCGKTTLLRAIAGLEVLDHGTVSFPGGRPPIGMVFQEPRLLPWKTVYENLELAVRHHPQAVRARAIGEALEKVGLADCAASRPEALSGGMAQRVALARALVRDPSVLLLDEPFSALDALTRGLLHREFAALHRHHATTTVLVTHDIHEAVLLADRVIHLEAGRVTHDWSLALPHPREPGDPALARWTATILGAVLAPPPTKEISA